MDARHRFALAVAVAAVIFILLRGHARLSSGIIAVWDTFALVLLLLIWMTILITPQHRLRDRARGQDFGRTAISIFVVSAACAALFAVGFLIRVHKQDLSSHFTVHLLLALSSVVLSWSLVHTVYSLRYAHTFYGDTDVPGEDRHAGGLIFPGDRKMPEPGDLAPPFRACAGWTRRAVAIAAGAWLASPLLAERRVAGEQQALGPG